MQTFLPDPDFNASAACLDYRRLGKQRVEAKQIHNIVSGLATTKGWRHHPAVLMWMGYSSSLAEYHNAMILEWISRGYQNTLPLLESNRNNQKPFWLGDTRLHRSHQSNLLRKDFQFYSRLGWNVPPNLPYYWAATATSPTIIKAN